MKIRLTLTLAVAAFAFFGTAVAPASGGTFSDNFSSGLRPAYWTVVQTTPGLFSVDDTPGSNDSTSVTFDNFSLAAASVPIACTPPPSGMIAWWPGDGNAHDISGNNNYGFEGPGTAFAAGKVAQAFQFNGDGGSEVTVPDAASLHATTGLTIDAWINPTAAGDVMIKGNFGSGSAQPYGILGFPSTPTTETIAFSIGNNSTYDRLYGTTIPYNTYTHIACTYDGTTMRIYVNGVLNQSKTTTIGTLNTTDTDPLIIGGGVDGPYTGAIDELEIFNRALSPTEIQAIYNAGSAGKCKPTTPPPGTSCTAPPSSMVAWYPAEGNATDIVGGNNGTLGSQTAFAAGKVGQAFVFNGVRINQTDVSAVTVPDSPSLHLTTALTIDAWVKLSNPVGDAILKKGNFGVGSDQPYGILLYRPSSLSQFAQIVLSIGNNSTYDRLGSGTLVPINTFTHIAATYDGTTMRIYINGLLDMTKTTAIGALNTTDTNPLFIGAGIDVPPAGEVDELEIFNRALSDTEVFNIFNAGSFGNCKTPTPVVTTNPATNVASFSATLNGSLNPHGSSTVYFQYGPTTSYGHTTPVQTQTGSTARLISANISGLMASHVYHFRIVAHNNEGTFVGSDKIFTTLSATGPPVVIASPATSIASFSSTLNGSVDPHGLTTSVHFQYGTTTSYGLTTAPQSHTGNTYLNLSGNTSGLLAGHVYHFRVVATNSAGTTFGGDRIFTTLSATGAPVVTTNPATNVTSSSATLNGSLDPHGLSTSVHFQYGATTSYGSTTATQSKTGNTYLNISANISGLSANHLYHFRIVATNSAGTRLGSDKTFTTP